MNFSFHCLIKILAFPRDNSLFTTENMSLWSQNILQIFLVTSFQINPIQARLFYFLKVLGGGGLQGHPYDLRSH